MSLVDLDQTTEFFNKFCRAIVILKLFNMVVY